MVEGKRETLTCGRFQSECSYEAELMAIVQALESVDDPVTIHVVTDHDDIAEMINSGVIKKKKCLETQTRLQAQLEEKVVVVEPRYRNSDEWAKMVDGAANRVAKNKSVDYTTYISGQKEQVVANAR